MNKKDLIKELEDIINLYSGQGIVNHVFIKNRLISILYKAKNSPLATISDSCSHYFGKIESEATRCAKCGEVRIKTNYY